jgi:tRNA-specific adenosine deaminase 3
VHKDVTTGRSSLLLALAPLEDAAAAPHPPDALALPPPYIVAVPARAAFTLTSLALKNSLWPTMYTPKRKSVAETWTRARVLWACEAVRDLARAALVAKNSGEVSSHSRDARAPFIERSQLPVASYVAVPHEPEPLNPLASPVCASDIRTSTAHPLRHSVLNVVRVLADLRATGTADAAVGGANGAHYLLTGLTLFATHEPCIMCAMALLHSRVRELVYIAPMPGTGGAGGAACVPALPGVNHRYGILRWRREGGWREWWDSLGLDVAPSVDA